MRCRADLNIAAAIVVILITLGFFMYSFNALEKANAFLRLYSADQIKTKLETDAITSASKCSLSQACPVDHYALHIWSGAANIIGPKICFNGKNIMSHALNNVGPGLNIVVINGENGVVEKSDYLNMISGQPEIILAYLKDIKPGMIVLVASFDDLMPKMTTEMREIFVGMGSTLIGSVKRRDSWVFAGRAGTKIKSLFEKYAVSNENTNIYEGWPEMVEVSGCFPRLLTELQQP